MRAYHKGTCPNRLERWRYQGGFLEEVMVELGYKG